MGLGRSQYSSLSLTARFRCIWSSPKVSLQHSQELGTTSAGTDSHPPRSMWDTACPAPTARQVSGCKASLARAWPELACTEQQGQALPPLTCLHCCYPDNKIKKRLFPWERCACVERHGAGTCCEPSGNIAPSPRVTEDTPRARQVLLPTVALPGSSSEAMLAVPSYQSVSGVL